MTWKKQHQGDHGTTRAGSAWHVDAETSARYADGTLSEPDAWSLEKHVEACTRCAATVSRAVRATGEAAADLAEVRASVLLAVADTASVGTVRPPTVRNTREPSHTFGLRLGRAVRAAGPALRVPWLLALLLVCATATGLAYGAGFDGARPLLLMLAPVLPLAGVALSYGPRADPLYEISAATPSGGLWLLLTRTAAVLGVSLPLLTTVGAVLPAAAGVPGAGAWLVPGLALALGALALGSFVGCRTATAVVAAGWMSAVLLPVLAARGGRGGGLLPVTALAEQLAMYLSGAAVQGGWAVAGALCAGLIALRRHVFDVSPGCGRGVRLNCLENL
ncbi:zf-HC2 domain-containing protein [Streptomyces lydicus]|uniref:zf-HC2 domain-containing protein n=1 Tax=Streptomyces lydicus TaxID=47763 RepID=UPI0036E6AE3E